MKKDTRSFRRADTKLRTLPFRIAVPALCINVPTSEQSEDSPDTRGKRIAVYRGDLAKFVGQRNYDITTPIDEVA